MGTLFRVLNSTLAEDWASSSLHHPLISQSLGVGQRERGVQTPSCQPVLALPPEGSSEGAGSILPDGPPSSTPILRKSSGQGGAGRAGGSA